MSSIDQPDPNYSSKHEPRRTLIPSSRLHEQGHYSLEWFGSRSAFLAIWSIVYAMLCIGALA